MFLSLIITQCRILYSHWIYKNKDITAPALKRLWSCRESQTCKIIAMCYNYMLEICRGWIKWGGFNYTICVRKSSKRKLTSQDERWWPLVRELGIMNKMSFQDKEQYDKKHGGLAECDIWRSMNNSACRKVGFEGKSEKK